MAREMVYPEYSAELFDGGDIRLRFRVPNSRFGAVYVVLTRDDAERLANLVDKETLASLTEPPPTEKAPTPDGGSVSAFDTAAFRGGHPKRVQP